jgi:hypothetical protein
VDQRANGLQKGQKERRKEEENEAEKKNKAGK